MIGEEDMSQTADESKVYAAGQKGKR